MKLYYTGDMPNNKTSSCEKSLGGYRSQIEVPNGMRGAILPDLSYVGYSKKNRSTVALIFKNDANTEITDVNIFITKPEDSLFQYSVGTQSVATDSDGRAYIGKIGSSLELPNSVEMYVVDAGEGISIDSIPAGGLLGIWVSREIVGQIDDLYESKMAQGIDEEWSLTIEE